MKVVNLSSCFSPSHFGGALTLWGLTCFISAFSEDRATVEFIHWGYSLDSVARTVLPLPKSHTPQHKITARVAFGLGWLND